MPIVRKQAGTRTIGLRIHTFRFDDESGRCRASGECEVCRNSLRSIRLYTTTSITKGTLRAGSGSNHYETPPFSNGASFSLPEACSSGNSGDRFELV